MAKKFEKGKMVPVPSHSIIPERDLDKSPILECSHLGIDFGGLRAVDDFNLTIGRTEIAGLIGPNGAGKTTVFNLLTKVYHPTRGTILLDGFDTSGKTTAQINRMGVARTFQNIRLFSEMSVEDNVKVGLHNQEKYSALTGVFRLPKYWRQEKAARERQDGEQVRQCLGGMLVAAVARVDDGDARKACRAHGRALQGMAHGGNVRVAGDDTNGIGHAFALGNAGYVGTGEAQHAAAQIEHRGFKRKTGAGAWLVKQSGKLFAFAAFRVGSRLTADIFAQPQKPVQLFHGKVQRVDQMAHIHSLQESLAGTAAAPGLLQAAR